MEKLQRSGGWGGGGPPEMPQTLLVHIIERKVTFWIKQLRTIDLYRLNKDSGKSGKKDHSSITGQSFPSLNRICPRESRSKKH